MVFVHLIMCEGKKPHHKLDLTRVYTLTNQMPRMKSLKLLFKPGGYAREHYLPQKYTERGAAHIYSPREQRRTFYSREYTLSKVFNSPPSMLPVPPLTHAIPIKHIKIRRRQLNMFRNDANRFSFRFKAKANFD